MATSPFRSIFSSHWSSQLPVALVNLGSGWLGLVQKRVCLQPIYQKSGNVEGATYNASISRVTLSLLRRCDGLGLVRWDGVDGVSSEVAHWYGDTMYTATLLPCDAATLLHRNSVRSQGCTAVLCSY